MIGKVVYDVESYPNYFLVAMKEVQTGKVLRFELRDEEKVVDDETCKKILRIFRNYCCVNFGGNHYDNVMILAWLDGWTTEKLNELSNDLVTSRRPAWVVLRERSITNRPLYNPVDLFGVAPGVFVSLKLYGARLHAPKLQDLPYDPNTLLSDGQKDRVSEYCENDLDLTQLLLEKLKPQLDLRTEMSEHYDIDMLSLSDAQIAERVITTKLGGERLKATALESNYTCRYELPDYIRFDSRALTDIVDAVVSEEFELGSNGAPLLPKSISRTVEVGGAAYKLGIGGLHSQEKNQVVIPRSDQCLVDVDAAAYYPNIMINQQLFPQATGKQFCHVFSGLVEERLAAKRNGDTFRDQSNKITINSTFGKFGSRYSFLYDPKLLLQVTLTGQFLLLMLIERMEQRGIKVMSANTDGIVCLFDKSLSNDFGNVIDWWQKITGLKLEQEVYTALYSRDVNNYFAVKSNGEIKGKGIFMFDDIGKNPFGAVIQKAFIAYCVKGIAPEDFVPAHNNINDYLFARSVTGGAAWRGEYLGKVVRWVYSLDGDSIAYKKNGNKVPNSDGAHPVMNLDDVWPLIDYDAYIYETNRLIFAMGV